MSSKTFITQSIRLPRFLPKLAEKATNRDLKQALKTHLDETNKQIERLDQVFKKLGQSPKGVDCPAIDGLIRESNQVMGEVEDKQVLDAAIIGSAQAVEHYEIARYGTIIAWAEETRPRLDRAPTQHKLERREGSPPCRERQYAAQDRDRCDSGRPRPSCGRLPGRPRVSTTR